MIDFKFYKELKLLAEKMGLPSDNPTMAKYVKLVEKFNESQIVEVNKLKIKNLEGRLQHGEIGVSRKGIKEHIKICKRVINGIDETMRMPVNHIRGSRIATLMTELDNSLWMFAKCHVKMNSSIEGQAECEEELIKLFNEKQDDLLLKAAFDGTKRHDLQFSLSSDKSDFGGWANYNKKESRFTFLQYSLRGYAKQIPI